MLLAIRLNIRLQSHLGEHNNIRRDNFLKYDHLRETGFLRHNFITVYIRIRKANTKAAIFFFKHRFCFGECQPDFVNP